MSLHSETPTTSRLRLWAPIALVLGSLLVGVVLTEVSYRVLRRFVCIGVSSAPVWRMDERFGWGHKPHGEGWMYSCLGRKFEWQAYSRINSLGLRDRKRTYERVPGTRRVLLLGDSMTEAMQVPMERTFAALAEANLQRRDLAVEVINAGVAAWGTDNALLYFRAEGVRFAPDAVVLVLNVMNDIVENSEELNRRLYASTPRKALPKPYFHLDERGELVAGPPVVLPKPPTNAAITWWRQIADRLYLVRALTRFLTQPSTAPSVPAMAPPAPVAAAAPAPAAGPAPPALMPAGTFNIYDVSKTTLDSEWSEAWRLTEALVRAFRADVERTGARFAVAIMPSREAVDPTAWKVMQGFFKLDSHDPELPVRRMKAFLEREGIRHLDLLPALRSAATRTGKTGFFSWDIHLTEPGHIAVGDALTPFVADLVTGN